MKAFSVIFLILNTLFAKIVIAGQRHYNISEEVWDTQFSRGKWDYLGKVSVERARNSVISGVFALAHAPKGRILDVGCGEGVLADYLNDDQRKLYLGLDLSGAAIKIAKRKREMLNFLQADAQTYVPPSGQKFDVIVFNEMIYYMDHKKMLEKYSSSQYLAKDGIIVISIWFTNKVEFLKSSIFSDATRILESIDSVDISGMSGPPGKSQAPVSFHIEAFRVRSK